MKNEEILKKAIEKAISNGWDMFGLKDEDGYDMSWKVMFPTLFIYINDEDGDVQDAENFRLNEVIFNHDFAKAFFGERVYEYASNGEKSGIFNHGWKYCLQEIVVLSDDEKLKYLEEFL